jgi:transcription elongation factor GreA
MEARVDHYSTDDVRADVNPGQSSARARHAQSLHVAKLLEPKRRQTRSMVCQRTRTRIAFTEAMRPAVPAGRSSFIQQNDRGSMIEALKAKLGAEVEKLQYELNVTLPGEIRKAVELGDLRENSEYKAALERQQFVQARLGQLRQRLSKLSSIDPTQIPNDRVGLGSRVVVEDEKTKVKETYYLVFGDAVEFEEGHVTMASPIGRALLGKAVGEVAFLKLPAGVRQLKVIELKTIHELSEKDVSEKDVSEKGA